MYHHENLSHIFLRTGALALAVLSLSACTTSSSPLNYYSSYASYNESCLDDNPSLSCK